MCERPEREEELERGADSGRPKRKRARGVRYGEEGRDEPGRLGEGVKVYGPHTVRGTRTMYLGTLEEVIVEKDHTGHERRASIARWEDRDDGDNKRLPYPEARSPVCPRGQEMEIHRQLVRGHEVRELEGVEVSSGRENGKKK